MKHIRIIAPSGAIETEFIDGAAARLRAWGYKVSEGAYARTRCGRFAGTDDQRAADLNEALNDPSVDMILCTRGGYGMQRIIDKVAPVSKPVIGFSDITALHLLAGLQNQPSLHGIMCKHIATLPEESAPVQALRKILAGGSVDYRWDAHPLNRPGKVQGPLIGGNLSVLYGLQATPYDLRSIPNSQFSILNSQFSIHNSQKPLLLIEDIAERHYHIDRMMRNLRLSGVLADIGGLIVGQFSDCDDDPAMGCSVYETIKEAVADYDYPVLFNAPVGHVEHNLPLWLNRHTAIESDTQSVLLQDGLLI